MKNIQKKDFFILKILKIVALFVCASALFLTNTYPFFKDYGKEEYGAIIKYIIVSVIVMAVLCFIWSIFARNIYDDSGIVRSDSAWNLVVAFSVLIAVILLLNIMFGFVYLDEVTPAFPSEKLTFSFRYIYEVYLGLFFPLVLLVTRKEMEADDEIGNGKTGSFNYNFVFSLIMAMTIAMMIIFLYFSGGGATFYIVMDSFALWFILVKNEKNGTFKRKNKLFFIGFVSIQIIIYLITAYIFDKNAFVRMNKLVSSPVDGHYYVPEYYWKQTVIGFVLGVLLFVIIKFMNTYKDYKRYGEVYDIVAYLFLIKSVVSVLVDFIPFRFVGCSAPFASYWAFADLMLLVPIVFTGFIDDIKIKEIIGMIKECSIGKYYEGVDDTVFMDKNSFSTPTEEYEFVKTKDMDQSETVWEFVISSDKTKNRLNKKEVYVDDIYSYKGSKYLICHRYSSVEGERGLKRDWLVLEEAYVIDGDSSPNSVKVKCVRVYDYKIVKKALRYNRNKYIRFLKEGRYTLGAYKELQKSIIKKQL